MSTSNCSSWRRAWRLTSACLSTTTFDSIALVDNPSSYDRCDHRPAKLPAVERGVLRFRLQRRGLNGDAGVGIQNRDVGDAAFREGSARQMEDARGVRRQQLDRPADADLSGVHEAIEHERHARLQPDDA